MQTAWTANSDQFGMSRYPDFECREFAEFEGKLCAITDEGVVLLDDDSADVSDIDASIEWDSQTFGSDALKRLRAAYIAYSATDTLLMTIGYIPDGEPDIIEYELPYRVADVLREGKFKLGRGARSRHFTIGFQSMARSRFTIYAASLILDVTARRI